MPIQLPGIAYTLGTRRVPVVRCGNDNYSVANVTWEEAVRDPKTNDQLDERAVAQGDERALALGCVAFGVLLVVSLIANDAAMTVYTNALKDQNADVRLAAIKAVDQTGWRALSAAPESKAAHG